MFSLPLDGGGFTLWNMTVLFHGVKVGVIDVD